MLKRDRRGFDLRFKLTLLGGHGHGDAVLLDEHGGINCDWSLYESRWNASSVCAR